MTQVEILTAAGKILFGGNHWQAGLTRLLGLKDSSRVRKMLAGSRPIPSGVWEEIEEALLRNRREIGEILEEVGELVEEAEKMLNKRQKTLLGEVISLVNGYSPNNQRWFPSSSLALEAFREAYDKAEELMLLGRLSPEFIAELQNLEMDEE